MLDLVSENLGVVPIVVSGGAALLPAILAGLTTALTLLFKPRELYHACRRRPIVAGGIAGVLLAIGATILLVMQSGDDTGTRRRGTATEANGKRRIDWVIVAQEILQAEEAGAPSRWLVTQPTKDENPSEPKTNPQPTKDPVTPAEPERSVIFRGGVERTGYDGGPVPTDLKLRWRHYPRWVEDDGTQEQDRDAMILSSPVARGNRIFGASCTLDPPGNYGAVFCLDAESGRQIWSVDEVDGDLLKGVFSSPAISADGRFLVIGQGLHPDANCRLLCFDAKTGRHRWSVSSELHIESSPAIEGNTVVVGAGAIEDPNTHKPISHPGYVLAVHLETGKELWRYDVADPESSPAIRDGVVYIGSGFNGQSLVALRIEPDDELKKNGQNRLLWRSPVKYPVTGAATVTDERVFVGAGNGDFVFRDPKPAGVVIAVHRKTGKRLWNRPMPDAVLGAVAAAGDLLVCPCANGEVVALSATDGEVRWRSRVSGHAPVLAGCALAGESVFAVSKDGYLARLNAKTGERLERHYLNATGRPGNLGLTLSSPFVHGGKLYVGSETGGLSCYVGGKK